MVIIAIAGLLLGSVLVILTGFAELIKISGYVLESGFHFEPIGKVVSVGVIEMIDLYLIGLGLIIFALGLFQLFIDPDLKLPDWLNTPSLETLKERLQIIILVLLPVLFLGHASVSDDGFLFAQFGIGIALVMIAIGYVLGVVVLGGKKGNN